MKTIRNLLFLLCLIQCARPAIAIEEKSYRDFQADLRFRMSFGAKENMRLSFGPFISADYGIFKHLRLGLEIAVPRLLQTTESGLRVFGDPYLIAAKIKAPFPLETKVGLFIPYMAVPIGAELGIGAAFVSGFFSGLNYFPTKHFGICIDAGSLIGGKTRNRIDFGLSLGIAFLI